MIGIRLAGKSGRKVFREIAVSAVVVLPAFLTRGAALEQGDPRRRRRDGLEAPSADPLRTLRRVVPARVHDHPLEFCRAFGQIVHDFRDRDARAVEVVGFHIRRAEIDVFALLRPVPGERQKDDIGRDPSGRQGARQGAVQDERDGDKKVCPRS